MGQKICTKVLTDIFTDMGQEDRYVQLTSNSDLSEGPTHEHMILHSTQI